MKYFYRLILGIIIAFFMPFHLVSELGNFLMDSKFGDSLRDKCKLLK